MENAELKLQKKLRNSKIQKVVLNSLYIAGALAVAVAAPNVLSLLKHLDPQKKGSRKSSVDTAIKRLREKGLVTWEKRGKGVFLRLTKQGEKAIRILERKEYRVAIPKKWDGKWRVIIFDIREKMRADRNKFRKTLIQIGFLKLQHSVWVYPYPCEELITLIKTDFKMGKEILYIIADSIENDKVVRKHFEL
ncbi:MAG: CRISPR-associated endonuclease Cas2 [Candidatus Paceibacterota bacterium]|jgi:DNA-binding transcriptional regulator PaaX